jgi:hypothetical protein
VAETDIKSLSAYSIQTKSILIDESNENVFFIYEILTIILKPYFIQQKNNIITLNLSKSGELILYLLNFRSIESIVSTSTI